LGKATAYRYEERRTSRLLLESGHPSSGGVWGIFFGRYPNTSRVEPRAICEGRKSKRAVLSELRENEGYPGAMFAEDMRKEKTRF